MRSALVMAICCIFLAACEQPSMKQDTVFTYPDTEQDPVVDVYFGTEVTDPYRWLEDDMLVDAQNAVTFAYLDTLPQKQAFAKSLARLLDYERESAPVDEGNAFPAKFWFAKPSGHLSPQCCG